MLANVSLTETLVSIARLSPCFAGGICQGIASDFIFNQLLIRITVAYAGPLLLLVGYSLPVTGTSGVLTDGVKGSTWRGHC